MISNFFNEKKGMITFILTGILCLVLAAAVQVNYILKEKRDKAAESDALAIEASADALASLDVLGTTSYTEDKTVFINPEKGFYKPLHSETMTSGDLSVLKAQNISVVLVESNLAVGPAGNYHLSLAAIKNAPLTAAKLAEIDNAFTLARNNGVKVLFRAAYDFAGIVAPEPTDKNVMLNHIAQLKPIFAKNEDVLYAVQAGMLGSWGEWHSTIYGDKATGEGVDYKYNSIPTTLQKEVISAMLAAVPKSRMVQIREPRYLRYVNNGVTINDTTAFNGSDVSRLGFHNDGLFYDINDCGTYSLNEYASGKVEYDRTKELVWMNTQMKYVPFGGESNGLSSYSDATNAVKEFNQLHAQYLNIAYYESVIAKWKATTYNAENAFNYISRNLSYKYLLTDSQISSKVFADGALHLVLNIKNDGFGSLINERNMEVVLSNGVNTYKANVNEDMRKWYRENGVMTKDLYFSLPANINTSTAWNIYLNFPDKSTTLKNNPKYSIRLANEGVWDATTGYNRIKRGIVIENIGLSNPNNTFAQIDRKAAEALMGFVVSKPVTSISLNSYSLNLIPAQTANLTATILPTDATVKTVTYTSSNPLVATVDSLGKVTAISEGTANITAKAISSGISKDCAVVVAKPIPVNIPVTSILFNAENINLNKGQSQTLQITILPSDATNKTVSYTSSNTAIASINSSGIVTGLSAGTVTITATTIGEGKTDICTVVVLQPVESIAMAPKTLSIVKGATGEVKATVVPAYANNQEVIYTSSNTAVATVNSTGTVTALSAGTANISGKSVDGNKTDVCVVTVTDQVVVTPPTTEISNWSNITPIATATTGLARSMKVYNNQTTLFVVIEGTGLNIKSQLYIDTDNNYNTGYKTKWTSSGADYLMENSYTYKYVGTSNRWSWTKVTSKVVLNKTSTRIYYQIPLSAFGITAGSTIHIGFLGNDNNSIILPARTAATPAYTLGNATNKLVF